MQWQTDCKSFDTWIRVTVLITKILKSIPSDDLNKSIDYLISTNFASKNRSRDKNRLFGYPLVISESVRSVIEFNDSPFDDDMKVLIQLQDYTSGGDTEIRLHIIKR